MNWLELYNKSEYYKIEKEYYKELRNYLAAQLKYKVEICKKMKDTKNVAVVCIGTNLDCVFYDNYGPLVGSLLGYYKFTKFTQCYGNMESPIHALNLQLFLEEKKQILDNSVVIAIDASADFLPRLGNMKIRSGAIFPGKASDKKLPAVGDISIMGITLECKQLLFGRMETLVDHTIDKETMEILSTMTSDVVAHSLHLSKRRR